jgi:hypothetical protein
MRSTAIDRRQFLAAAAATLAAWPLRGAIAAARGPFVSSRADAAGTNFVTGFDSQGGVAFDHALPTRGHGSAFAPDGTVVHFARRPGRFALVIDPTANRVVHVIDSIDGRHFEGHGAFSPDGRLLYATENDYEVACGVIGVYDVADGWRRVAEFDTGGMDPHEMRLMPDGTTLVVANGGILTHPDYPQENLDPQGMDPSLAYVDRRDGRMLALHRLPADLRQLSIHHLAVARDGAVFAVVQDAIKRADVLPLIIEHRPGSGLAWVDPGEDLTARLKGYCGSAALDSSESVLAVSSPRGGCVLFWDRAAGRVLGSLDLADVCGLAPGGPPGVFLVTSGRGGALIHDARAGRSMQIAAPIIARSHWDNHVFVPAA